AGDGGDEVGAPGEPARERADERMADVGPVEGDEERAGAGGAGDPAGQAVVGVNEVVPPAAQDGAPPARRGEVIRTTSREAEFLDLDPAGAHLGNLVADPAPTLGSVLVGYEVGDHQDSHRGRLSVLATGTDDATDPQPAPPSPLGLLECPV